MSGERAAIYARFSTAHQSERSVEDQVALCRQYADRHGLTVVATRDDRAMTGGTMIGREGLAAVLDLARRRAIDVVLVEALDRLSRDIADLATLHKSLTFCGVRIVAVHEGVADTIAIGLRGLVAQLYREDGAKKVRRGMQGVVRDGRSPGGRSYGYRPVPGKPGELVIDEAEAEVVRSIFRDFAAGITPRDIAFKLNTAGVAPPRGARWNASTINGSAQRGHGLLRNPVFQGKIVWNRVSMVRDPETGRRVSRPNPETDWIATDAPHLAIVDPEIAARVARRLDDRRRESGVPVVRTPRLLSGLLRCGVCGAGMSIADRHRGRPRIACSRSRESGSCASSKRVFLDAIEHGVIDHLKAALSRPEAVERFLAAYRVERQAAIDAAVRDRSGLEREIAQADAGISRLVASIADGVLTTEEARQRIAALRATKAAAEDRLEVARAQAEPIRIDRAALRRYAAALRDLPKVLDDVTTEQDMAVIEPIRDLISSVIVTPGQAYQPPAVEIRGRLAALIEQGPDVVLRVVAEEDFNRGKHIVLARFFTSRADKISVFRA